jgi:ATP-dependent Clp protease ATP-binding subunit ClpC
MSLDEDLIDRLTAYGTVLNRTVGADGSIHAHGREKELELLLGRLARPTSRSFVLVGRSGCGKSAILDELVRRAERDLPEPWIVLETSASMLLAGTRYLGEMETRVKGLIDAARRPARVLLYFTDVFALVEAGRSAQSDVSIGSFLMPFIDSGDITLVGECTPEQFRAGFERNPTYKKLFDVVRIDEQPPHMARQVLRHVADGHIRALAEQDVELRVSDDVLDRVFELSESFFAGMCHPGKCVQLLDQVVSLETSSDNGDARRSDKLRTGPITLSAEAVVRALHRFTGIPSLLLDDAQPLDLDGTRAFFEERVLGQPEAIDAVVDLITLVKAGVTDPNKPMGVFFFVGPTGVGKTELAKALAEFIFGSAGRMLRFDMSEYKDYSSFEKLIGDPQAKEGTPMHAGTLTGRVRQEPFAVILLDEIEKAHPNIFDLFLQVFDDGRLTDPSGQTTRFTQTIIIMTSNVGSDIARDRAFGFHPDRDTNLQDDITTAMKAAFRPEFLNRLDRIVFFQPLGREHMRRIAQRELGHVLTRSGIARRNMRIDVDPGVIDVLLKEGFSRAYGARPLKRAVERLALLPIARQMVRLRKSAHESLLRLLAVGDRIKVTIVQADEERPAEVAARAVTIVDPVKKRKVKVTPDRLGQQLTALDEQIRGLEATCQAQGLATRKAELLERCGRPDFWDDLPAARETLGEIHRLERLEEAVERVRQRTDDLTRLLEHARRARDPEALARAAERLPEVRRHADLVGYSVRCQGPLDRCDAFVDLTLIGDAAEHDLVGLLADMYANWARGKGFQPTVVHEELLDPQRTRRLTLLVEGISVYGILRGEEGVHEMIYGRTSKTPKESRYVKARVLPLVEDDPPHAQPGDLVTRREPVKGEGLRVKRYKSRVRASQRGGLLAVETRNGLEGDEAARAAGDLLRAEAFRRNGRRTIDGTGLPHDPDRTERDPSIEQDGQVEAVIRKYTLRPTQSVKDQRTGATMSGLANLWNGALDAFLHAHVELRNEDERRTSADGMAPSSMETRASDEAKFR